VVPVAFTATVSVVLLISFAATAAAVVEPSAFATTGDAEAPPFAFASVVSAGDAGYCGVEVPQPICQRAKYCARVCVRVAESIVKYE
jgi:hypothetical protein